MFGTYVRTIRNVYLKESPLKILLQTRTKMKSHKAAAKRFIRTAEGFKRKQAGRNHGNGRFSSHSLNHLDPFVPVTTKAGHLKKLERYIST